MSELVTLKMVNVGGIEGQKIISLPKNTLSIIEGANATGKSSVAKALIAIHGIDNRVLHDSHNNIWRLEAINIGILPEKGGYRAGIVHAKADKAEIELVEGNKLKKVVIYRNGKIDPNPEANSTFLLTSVLTPNSWIYRAISSPNDMRNESIFKNYITRLSSKSDRYERVSRVLQEIYSELFQILSNVKRKKAMIPTLKKEISQIESEIKTLKAKKEQLIEMIKVDDQTKREKIAELKKKLQDLEDEKSKIDKEIRILENDLNRNTNELEKLRKNVISLQNDKKTLESELAKIKEILSKPLDTSEFEKQQENLRDERTKLQGLADLFYIALDNLENGKTVCPLCKTGHITKAFLETELKKVKEEIVKIEEQLRSIARKIDEVRKARESLKKRKEEIEKLLKRITDEFSLIQGSIKKLENDIENHKKEIKTKKESLLRIIKEIDELNEALKKENPELIEEINRVTEEINKRENLLKKKESEYVTSGYVEIFGLSVDIEQAIKVLEKVVESVNEARKYALEIAEKIRREAVKQFNDMIQEVLKRAGFSEFKKIYLDKDYILNVQYISPEGEIKVIQPSALSESERITVALVLMLALNKVYGENIRYIVIDNIYEYFDEYRTEEILKVLQEYAKREKVTIILTKTSYESKELTITTL